ncbi:tetratricopeptide repeat protein [Candidatus Poribacteria bacterium]|nr:tetratricopeptide repeat protein [Candidatus Poribacteria bacterium]
MIPAKGTNFYMANRFYYEEQNYDEAIKMYQAAITEESDELIVAKSLYYMAESYIKLKKLSEAIAVFEDLAGRLPGHYLVASAKRRIDILKEDMKL